MVLEEDPRVQYVQSVACTLLDVDKDSFRRLLRQKSSADLLQTFLDGSGRHIPTAAEPISGLVGGVGAE